MLAINGPPIQPRPSLAAPDEAAIWQASKDAVWAADVKRLTAAIGVDHPLAQWPLLIIVDNSDFAAASLENLLWTTFTRSNPAADVHGVGETIHNKHWGCTGPLVIDARLKPHHAPPVEEDPAVTARIDDLCRRGGPLAGIIE